MYFSLEVNSAFDLAIAKIYLDSDHYASLNVFINLLQIDYNLYCNASLVTYWNLDS